MGLKFKRNKPKHLLMSVLYRTSKLRLIPKKTKFKLYLDLAWIYDRLSHTLAMEYYTPENSPARINTMEFLSRNLSKNQTILDIGCSSGDLSYLISDYVDQVTGIDHNVTSINQAKNKYVKNNLDFIHGDAIEHLKQINTSYDIIIMSHLLEHIESPETFLKKYIPYTKFFYIEVPDIEKTYHNVYRKDIGSKLLYSDNDHISEFDREEIEHLFKNLELTVVNKQFRFGVMHYFIKSNN